MLYDHPLSRGVDYSINNVEENQSSFTDKNAGDFLRQKAESKVGENEKALLYGNYFGPISCAWTFSIFRYKYREPEGAPIVRIMGRLGAVGKAVYRESEPGVRNPAGVWGRLGKKRHDMESLGRHLTNREIYNYFKGRRIVNSHKLAEVIRKHCLTVEFMEDLEDRECDIWQGGFSCFSKKGRWAF